MEQTGDAARLAREVRVWRAVACALAVLVAPAGMALGQDGAPAATVRPIAVLEAPPDSKLKIVRGRMEQELAAKKGAISGGVTLTWSSGVRFTVPATRVSFASAGRKLGTRWITMEP